MTTGKVYTYSTTHLIKKNITYTITYLKGAYMVLILSAHLRVHWGLFFGKPLLTFKSG